MSNKNWFNSRLNIIFASVVDTTIFISFFYQYKDKYFLNLFFLISIWILGSYFFGRYASLSDKRLRFEKLANIKNTILCSAGCYAVCLIILNLLRMDLSLFNNISFNIKYFIFNFLSFFIQINLLNLNFLSKNYKKNVLIFSENDNLKLNEFQKLYQDNPDTNFFESSDKYYKYINKIDEIILLNYEKDQKIINELPKLIQRGVSFYTLNEWCEKYLKRIPSELITNKDLLEGKWRAQSKSTEMRIKRFGDILLSIILLVFTSPIILICGLAIKLQDGGPIFYRQERTGLWGNSFNIIKLRTMVVDAEKHGIRWSSKDDSRVTLLGKLLRKFRIDELPQLCQVISGEMSLIGPRPERPALDKILKSKIVNYNIRHWIRPGISGWAQVNYPYGASIEDTTEKLSYDIYYLKKFSFWLDLVIFFKTIKLLINAQGSDPKQR